MAEVVIETPRLLLWEWDDAAWASFTTHTNTPAVMRWLGGVFSPESVLLQRQRIENCRALHGHCFWLVERKADGGHLAGEVLGFCGIKRADAPDSSVPGQFEIGWRLREDAWGQGYAREAAEASLNAAFGIFGAQEVVALTVVENTASWGLMERLGMTRRPEWDHHDPRYSDELNPTIVYAIERENFR